MPETRRDQASIEVPRALLLDLIDPDPCWYDHHGYCQAHHLHEAPCPHQRAKDLLAEGQNDEEAEGA